MFTENQVDSICKDNVSLNNYINEYARNCNINDIIFSNLNEIKKNFNIDNSKLLELWKVKANTAYVIYCNYCNVNEVSIPFELNKQPKNKNKSKFVPTALVHATHHFVCYECYNYYIVNDAKPMDIDYSTNKQLLNSINYYIPYAMKYNKCLYFNKCFCSKKTNRKTRMQVIKNSNFTQNMIGTGNVIMTGNGNETGNCNYCEEHMPKNK